MLASNLQIRIIDPRRPDRLFRAKSTTVPYAGAAFKTPTDTVRTKIEGLVRYVRRSVEEVSSDAVRGSKPGELGASWPASCVFFQLDQTSEA